MPAQVGGLWVDGMKLHGQLRLLGAAGVWHDVIRPAGCWLNCSPQHALSLILHSPTWPASPPSTHLAGVSDLGGLVKSVLLRMAMHNYGPPELRRLTSQLKQVGACCCLPPPQAWLHFTRGGHALDAAAVMPCVAALTASVLGVSSCLPACPPCSQVGPRLSPFSFWLLRQCAAGSGTCGLLLAAQQERRVGEEEALSASLDALFARHQEQVLYSSAAWVGWLQALPTRHLVALYIKYLYDGFQ
jgi:hypothetical protein